jgi:hypothetical protein
MRAVRSDLDSRMWPTLPGWKRRAPRPTTQCSWCSRKDSVRVCFFSGIGPGRTDWTMPAATEAPMGLSLRIRAIVERTGAA